MHVLGVVKTQDRLRWVLAYWDEKLVIEQAQESLQIPEDVLSIKNLKIVTGLEGSSVLRRDLKLPLTTSNTIFEALPFQLEPLLPFPLDQSIIYPQMHHLGKETFVAAWVATYEIVTSHLEKWKLLNLEPDLISCETLALARWARAFFPKEPELVVIHENLGVALQNDRILCAMESSDPARLKLFLKQKYPLFTWVEQGPSPQEWSFAIPIGLAMEAFQKSPCQFRPKDALSSRQRLRHRFLMRKAFGAGIGLTLLTVLVSSSIFYYKEAQLKKEIAMFHELSKGSLEENVQSFRNSLLKVAKTKTTAFNFPSTQEVLAWLSTKSAPIEITHFEYEIHEPLLVKIGIDFQAPAPSVADQFIKQLQQSPTFVEATQGLKWTSHPQGYKLFFELQAKP